jgi:hypothetical protein
MPHLIDRIVYDSAFCCVDLACPEDYLTTPEGSTTLAGDVAALVVTALPTRFSVAPPMLPPESTTGPNSATVRTVSIAAAA